MSTSPITGAGVRDIIRARAREAFALENQGDETLEAQISSHFYTFPPGVPVHIADRLDWKRGKKGALLHDEPRFVPVGGEADTIAAQIMAEDRLGARGLCFIFGDGHDDERRRLARGQYIRYRVGRARQRQIDWINKVSKIMASPGALPPVQSQDLTDDLNFLARYEAGLIDRKKYISRIDGFESDTRQTVIDHILRLYAQQVTNAGGDVEQFVIDRDQVKPPPAAEVRAEIAGGTAPAATPMVPPAAAAVGSTLPQNDVAFLVDKAEELGVNLTKAQLVALLRGDGATVEAVTNLLAEAQVKRPKKGDRNA